MKGLLKWIRSYFDLTRSEANGFLVLMLIMLISIFGLFYYKNSPTQVAVANQASLDSLLAEIKKNAFLDTVSYKQQGYQNRKSYQAENRPTPAFSTHKVESKPKHKYVLAPFDINYADTIQLKKLRGIGPVLSKRIIKFRDVLGGYVSKDQLAEVYGLQDSVLWQMDSLIFISEDFEPSKININETAERELSKHPYISRSMAKALVNYKFQHGAFTSIEELSNIHLIDSLTLVKITPYISF